jgi:hypothetical protein
MAALNTLPIENSSLAFAILTCGVATGMMSLPSVSNSGLIGFLFAEILLKFAIENRKSEILSHR